MRAVHHHMKLFDGNCHILHMKFSSHMCGGSCGLSTHAVLKARGAPQSRVGIAMWVQRSFVQFSWTCWSQFAWTWWKPCQGIRRTCGRVTSAHFRAYIPRFATPYTTPTASRHTQSQIFDNIPSNTRVRNMGSNTRQHERIDEM